MKTLPVTLKDGQKIVCARVIGHFTLLVSGLMWLCVSLSREMELLLRPPTTAISVLKFCNCSSFCQREGGDVRGEGESGDSKGISRATTKRVFRAGRTEKVAGVKKCLQDSEVRREEK